MTARTARPVLEKAICVQGLVGEIAPVEKDKVGALPDRHPPDALEAEDGGQEGTRQRDLRVTVAVLDARANLLLRAI